MANVCAKWKFVRLREIFEHLMKYDSCRQEDTTKERKRKKEFCQMIEETNQVWLHDKQINDFAIHLWRWGAEKFSVQHFLKSISMTQYPVFR